MVIFCTFAVIKSFRLKVYSKTVAMLIIFGFLFLVVLCYLLFYAIAAVPFVLASPYDALKNVLEYLRSPSRKERLIGRWVIGLWAAFFVLLGFGYLVYRLS